MSINAGHSERYLSNLRDTVQEMTNKNLHPFKEAFKFSIVRNPWERFVSMYHYHREDFGGLGDFTKFCRSFQQRTSPIITQQTHLSLTQTEFLSIDNPEKVKILEQEDANPLMRGGMRYANSDTSFLGCDYIGRYEKLDDAVTEITSRISGIRKDLLGRARSLSVVSERPLNMHENKSSNSPTSYCELYMDFETIYTVAEYYYEDIVNFGYTFSGTSNCMVTKECLRRYQSNGPSRPIAVL
jgi:hypothetical protein